VSDNCRRKKEQVAPPGFIVTGGPSRFLLYSRFVCREARQERKVKYGSNLDSGRK